MNEIYAANGESLTRYALRKAPVWISTKESLPAINQSVIFCSTRGYIGEGVYLGNKWIQYRWSAELKPDEVSYWMPFNDLVKVDQIY